MISMTLKKLSFVSNRVFLLVPMHLWLSINLKNEAQRWPNNTASGDPIETGYNAPRCSVISYSLKKLKNTVYLIVLGFSTGFEDLLVFRELHFSPLILRLAKSYFS